MHSKGTNVGDDERKTDDETSTSTTTPDVPPEGASSSQDGGAPPSPGAHKFMDPLMAAQALSEQLAAIHRVLINMRVGMQRQLPRVADLKVRSAVQQQIIGLDVQATMVAAQQTLLALVANMYCDVAYIAGVYKGEMRS